MTEQGLFYLFLVSIIGLIPCGLGKNIQQTSAVLLGLYDHSLLTPKKYPDGCLKKTWLFSVTYCAGSSNVVISPDILKSDAVVLKVLSNFLVLFSQFTSFFVRLFPYFSFGKSLTRTILHFLVKEKLILKKKNFRLFTCIFAFLSCLILVLSTYRCYFGVVNNVLTAAYLNTFFIFFGMLYGVVLKFPVLYSKPESFSSKNKDDNNKLSLELDDNYYYDGFLYYAAAHVCGITCTLLKGYIKDPRPSSYYPPFTAICAASYGLPSEHTSVSVTWIGILWMLTKKKFHMRKEKDIREKQSKSKATKPEGKQKKPMIPFCSSWLLASTLFFALGVPLGRYILGYHTILQLFWGYFVAICMICIILLMDYSIFGPLEKLFGKKKKEKKAERETEAKTAREEKEEEVDDVRKNEVKNKSEKIDDVKKSEVKNKSRKKNTVPMG